MSSHLFSVERGKKEQKLLTRFFIISFVAHLAFFGFMTGTTLLFDLQPSVKIESIEARLVRFGKKKRDKKMLPRIYKKTKPKVVTKKKNEKGNTLKKSPKKKAPKPKKKKIVKKKKKDINLDNLLGAAMDDIKKDARAEESDEGSLDGAKDGDVTDPAFAVKGSIYMRKVSTIIRRNWSIPTILKENRSLKAEIFWRITRGGEIYDISTESSSGNTLFDSSIVEALKKTGKLPLPEDKKVRKYVLKEGLQWAFSPE